MDVIDEDLSRLPHLQTVILETTDLNDSAEFASGLIRVGNRVRRRTCAQAQRLALGEADAAGLPDVQASAAVSLLWHHDYTADRRDHGYWCVSKILPLSYVKC